MLVEAIGTKGANSTALIKVSTRFPPKESSQGNKTKHRKSELQHKDGAFGLAGSAGPNDVPAHQVDVKVDTTNSKRLKDSETFIAIKSAAHHTSLKSSFPTHHSAGHHLYHQINLLSKYNLLLDEVLSF